MRDLLADIAFWLGWLALATFILLQACGGDFDLGPVCEQPEVTDSSARIVNGTPSIFRRATVRVTSPRGYCSGTIIGPHTVLTAGHCEELTKIEVGSLRFDVVENVLNPYYRFPLHDLRLLYTEEELPRPYAPLRGHEPCEYLLAQGYGFGSNGALHERRVDHLLRNGSSIIGTESICNGDSGGPLYAVRADGSYVLVGVSSFGLNKPRECLGGAVGFVDLLTDTRTKIEWIEENLR